MKKTVALNNDWIFCKEGVKETVNLPHTWNGIDGQGGTDGSYYRGACTYTRILPKYEGTTYIEFKGANSVATVKINGRKVGTHAGGYSTFRFDISKFLTSPKNFLEITVDNSENKKVYPSFADFTFYGGLYREVNLITDVPETRFSLDDFGSKGIYVTAKADGKVKVKAVISNYKKDIKVVYEVLDKEGNIVATAGDREKLQVENPVLWNGLKNPYLYTLRAKLVKGEEIIDKAEVRFGFRTIKFDSNEGCILNGEYIKLKGVSRHQDREEIGNALTIEEHKQDLEIIKEMGANSLRLAHYQQAGEFYDLCDEMGFLVWAEIPVISRFSKAAQDNALSQLEELIKQNMHHASIYAWGVQNEITITNENETLIEGIKELHDYAKLLDPSRPTTCAQFTMAGIKSELNRVTDILAYNHYFGWYMKTCDGLDEWLAKFREANPDLKMGISEYGAEGVLGYFSDNPVQGDYSEGYQAIYHEHYLKSINANKWIWGSYVWNMFDFGSAVRNEGGVKGRNNKGLVTFDRKTKKDSFWLYKAFWAEDKFIHLVGDRYPVRKIGSQTFKVYSNCDKVQIKVNNKQKTVTGEYIFVFEDMEIKAGENKITVTAGDIKETFIINGVEEYPAEYTMPEGAASMVRNWFVEKDSNKNEDCFSLDDKVGDLLKSEEILGMVGGFAGKLLKSPLMLAVKPFTLRQLLDLPVVNLSEEMVAMVEDYLGTIKK